MSELLGEDGGSKLSDSELCLLILSAYCHDVGMTPDRKLSDGIRSYLITGDSSVVSKEISDDLRAWMDEHTPHSSIPISDSVTLDSLSLIDYICSHYGRDRHNEWSELWVRAEFDYEKSPKLYSGWLEDLILICKSHHYGLSELRQDKFDAKIAGTPPQNINLRFLAAILRLADVMEFDPERTPEVILKSRNVSASSKIYWYKDHSISFQLNRGQRQVIFTARTQNATIHRAVLTTAKWVDDELLICGALAQEGGYQRGNISEAAKAAYEWPWPTRLTADIKPIPGTFEYIDGAFRPDPARILSLLSGTALYGREIVAIRELLQNGVDAVLEEMAYARLQSPEPSSQSVTDALAQLNSVTLRLYEEDGRHWIQCVDTGAGMTKSIIERCLLVGGSAPRGEIQSLERAARTQGFEVGRTGKFGIGVLSYFMIADRLEVTTRRSQRAAGVEQTGWRFVIEGLADFGELRREPGIASGSDIRLRMKPEFVGEEPNKWVGDVFSYVNEIARWMPCKLSVVDEISDHPPFKAGPGWTGEVLNISKELWSIPSSEFSDSSVRPEDELNQYALLIGQREQLSQNLKSAFRWAEPSTIALSGGRGIARLSVPYFAMPGGKSLGYVALDGDEYNALPGVQELVLPRAHRIYSWKGFLVSQETSSGAAAWGDIDLVSGVEISVNRNSFSKHELPTYLSSEIHDASREIFEDFLRENSESPYHLLNQVICLRRYSAIRESEIPGYVAQSQLHWKIRSSGSKDSIWQGIQFPICVPIRTSFMNDIGRYPLRLSDESINFAEPVYDRDHSGGLSLAHLFGGGRVAIEGGPGGYGSLVGLVWDTAAAMRPLDGSLRARGADFPLEWGDLIGVSSAVGPIINKGNGAFALLSEKAVATHVPTRAADLKRLVDALMQSGDGMVEFVVGALGHGQSFWRALHERHSEFFAYLIASFRNLGHERIVILRNEAYSNTVIELSSRGVRYSHREKAEYTSPILPDIIDPEWKMTTKG
ncbi:MAG: hypothetical protein AB1542_08670 [Pseudomonadota bacterium]